MFRARSVIVFYVPAVLGSLFACACSGTPFSTLPDGVQSATDAAAVATDAGVAPPSIDGAAPTDGASDALATGSPDAFAPGDAMSVEGAADAGAAESAPAHASCAVTFTVTGAYVDGVLLRGVSVGGDAPALGAWNPSSAVALAPIAPGVWTGDVVLVDGAKVQFRFLETGPTEIVWESWGAGSNRSLTVACAPADGKSGAQYVGQFDVKPADAT
jgi:hypothetical protein